MAMKLKIPLFSLFLTILLLSLFTIPIKAQISYYNWVENSDFSQYTAIAEDGGAESGNFNSGVTYGNFSSLAAGTTIESLNAYAGVYHFRLADMGFRYNFTSGLEILGGDIEEFSFWGYASGSLVTNVWVYYSDYTSNTDQDTTTSNGVYVKVNVLTALPSLVNVNKYVVAFDIRRQTGTIDIDEVIFRCGQIGGQATIDYYSYPWYCTGSLPLDIGLDIDVGHNSLGSGYIGGTDWGGELIQTIDYLDTDYIHYFDLWVYSTVVSDITLTVVYSDGTSDISYEAIEAGDLSSWSYKVFSGFFDSNKYVSQIQIGILNAFTGQINFDDCGLWASVQYVPDETHFSFVISPTPIGIQGFQVVCYLTITYQFYGYIRNSTGGLSDEGTFSVIHNLGTTSGNIYNGQFNFTIQARQTIIQIYENFGILLILPNSIEEYTVIVEWRRLAGQDITQPEEDIPWISTPSGSNFLVMLFLVFIPPTMLGAKFAQLSQSGQSGLLGFMIGLAITTAIGFLSGLMPLWFLFLMVLAFVIFILYALKGGF